MGVIMPFCHLLLEVFQKDSLVFLCDQLVFLIGVLIDLEPVLCRLGSNESLWIIVLLLPVTDLLIGQWIGVGKISLEFPCERVQ